MCSQCLVLLNAYPIEDIVDSPVKVIVIPVNCNRGWITQASCNNSEDAYQHDASSRLFLGPFGVPTKSGTTHTMTPDASTMK